MKAFVTMSCLIAVVLGALAIFMHSEQLQTIVFLVACVWFLSNILVSGAYRREYWKGHDVTISQFLDKVRIGRWPEKSALDRATGLGAEVLMLASVGLYFV